MKTIALVAHDNKKDDIVEWCNFNKGKLSKYSLYSTGSTGKRIIKATGLEINLLKSGPLGEICSLELLLRMENWIA